MTNLYRFTVTVRQVFNSVPQRYVENTLAANVEEARAIIRERYHHAYEIQIES